MKENEIPTAEEFLDSRVFNKTKEQITIIMVEFAKIHVKAALEAAVEKAELIKYTDNFGDPAVYLNKNSILSAYPEELIK